MSVVELTNDTSVQLEVNTTNISNEINNETNENTSDNKINQKSLEDIASVSIETTKQIINETEREYQKILESISNRIKKSTISPSTITKLIRFVMEEMENSTIKGEERKNIAIKIIRELISDNDEISEETKNLCLQLIDNGVIENTIELIIQATRGNLNINTVKNVSKGCLINCLTACLVKKNVE